MGQLRRARRVTVVAITAAVFAQAGIAHGGESLNRSSTNPAAGDAIVIAGKEVVAAPDTTWWRTSDYQPSLAAASFEDAGNVAADLLRIDDKHVRYAGAMVDAIGRMGHFDLDEARSAVGLEGEKAVEGETGVESEAGSREGGGDPWAVRAGVPGGLDDAAAEARSAATRAQTRLDDVLRIGEATKRCLPRDLITPVSIELAPRLREAGVEPANDQWAVLLNAYAGLEASALARVAAVDAAGEARAARDPKAATDALGRLDAAVATSARVEAAMNQLRSVVMTWGKRRVPTTLNPLCPPGLFFGVEPFCAGLYNDRSRTGSRPYPAPANTGDGSAYRNSEMFTPSDGATISPAGATLDGTATVSSGHPWGNGFGTINVAAHIIDSWNPEHSPLAWQNVYVATYDGAARMGPEGGGATFYELYRPLCYSNHDEQTAHYFGNPASAGDVWFGYLDAAEIVDQVTNHPNLPGDFGYLGMTANNTTVPAFHDDPAVSKPFITVRTQSVRRFALNFWNPEDAIDTADDYRTVFVNDAAPVPPGSNEPNVGARLDDNTYDDVVTAGTSFVSSFLTNANISKIFLNDIDGSGPDQAQPRFESSSISGLSISLDSVPVVNPATGETKLRAKARLEQLKFNVKKTNGDHAGTVKIGPIRVEITATVDVLANGRLSANLESSGIDIGAVDIDTDCFAFCYQKSAAVRNFVDNLGTKLSALLGQTGAGGGSGCWGFKKIGFSGGAILGAIVGMALAGAISVVTGGAALAAAPLIIGGLTGALAGGSVGFSNCSTVSTNGEVIDPSFWDNMAGFWGTIIGDFDVHIDDDDTNPASLESTLAGLEADIAALDPNALVAGLEQIDTDGDGVKDTKVREASAKFLDSCVAPNCTNGMKIEATGVEVVGRVDIAPDPLPAGWGIYDQPNPPSGFSVRELVNRETTLSGQPFDMSAVVGMDGLQAALTSFLGASLSTSSTKSFNIPAVGAPVNLPPTQAEIKLDLTPEVPPVIRAEPFVNFNGGPATMSNGQPYPYTLYVPGLTLRLTVGSIDPPIAGIDPGSLVLRANVGFRAGLGVSAGPDGVIKVEIGLPGCPGTGNCPVHVDYEDSEYLPDYIAPDLPSLADEAMLGNLIKDSFQTQILTEINQSVPSGPIDISASIPNSMTFTLFNGPTGAQVPGGITTVVDLPDFVQVETGFGSWGVAAFFRFTPVSAIPAVALSSWSQTQIPGLGPDDFGSVSITASPTSFPGSGNHTFAWTLKDNPSGSTQTSTTSSAGASSQWFDTGWLTWTFHDNGAASDTWEASVTLTVTVTRAGHQIAKTKTGHFVVVECGSSGNPC